MDTKLIKFSFLFLVVINLWGCTTHAYKEHLDSKALPKVKNRNYCLTELSKNGSSVKVTHKRESIASCRFIKKVEADHCPSDQSIHEGSINQLRNETALLKADTLLMTVPFKLNEYQRVVGSAFVCP